VTHARSQLLSARSVALGRDWGSRFVVSLAMTLVEFAKTIEWEGKSPEWETWAGELFTVNDITVGHFARCLGLTRFLLPCFVQVVSQLGKVNVLDMVWPQSSTPGRKAWVEV
jgi:hypothetical protein